MRHATGSARRMSGRTMHLVIYDTSGSFSNNIVALSALGIIGFYELCGIYGPGQGPSCLLNSYF